ncbi:MAG TPA: MBL fold metallo-hydrolase [Dictyoglomaceae bacterium]|nr:MBL fold metallo-hydrolase [Dictyoglomaceae bacterium]HPP16697.1 MBL fold metallo-hydrolase [Dictyoglomaceae bacterium]
MKTDEYKATLVEPKVWHISDYREDSMYLIEGIKRAILFDTGMGTGNLKGFLEGLTEKPIEVVISHAHWDHIMQANLFDKVYMSPKDQELIKIFDIKIDYSNFIDIKEGDIFDLGDRILEVIETPGHTPGSIVLLDEKNKLLFSGDAVGAGHVWMHLPGCAPLKAYLETLKKLEGRLNKYEKIYNGHLAQKDCKPVPNSYILDLIKAVEKVISGELKGESYPYSEFKGLYVTYGSATLVYNPENIG